MKETRKLDMYDLRTLCIKHNWYTRGDNEEYGNLLTFANDCDNITTEDIVKIATNIHEHSEIGEYEIPDICFAIAEICHSFFEEERI